MLERKISRADVEATVLNPERVMDSKKGRKIAQSAVNNMLLRVIYKETEKVYIIVTVYYTRIGRY